MHELTIKEKLTNYYYFVIFNSILACLIGIGYWFNNSFCAFVVQPNISDWVACTYTLCMHCIILITISYIFWLLLLPTIFIKTTKQYSIQFGFAFIFLSVLLIDIIVFHADSIHLIDVDLLQITNSINDKSIMLTKNKLIASVVWLFLSIFIYIVSYNISSFTWLSKYSATTKTIKFLAILCVIATSIYYSSDNNRKLQLQSYIQRLPLCCNIDNQIAKKLQKTTEIIAKGKINYPLSSLKTKTVVKPPNILIIAIDAWRDDYFNAKHSPNLFKFAQNGKIFYNHKSGSNRTNGGIFSLFYSLPASYFNNMLETRKTPVLFTRLQQLNYQVGIFNSAANPLESFIDKNKLPNNSKLDFKIYANSVPEADEMATNKLLNWYQAINNNNPWFAFIFYNCAHENAFPDGYSKDYRPHTKNMRFKDIVAKYGKQYFIESYRLGVAYDDFLAGKILQELAKNNDLDNTIVIITSDHGKEMNETGNFQWGFATNFTDYQIKVPFAIIAPNIDNTKLNWDKEDLTTHYDVVPTLMKNFLGVENDINNYSIGIDLIGNKEIRNHSIASSFSYYSTTYSIVGQTSSMSWFSSGKYWFTDNMNRYLAKQVIDMSILDQAFEYMTRFIKK